MKQKNKYHLDDDCAMEANVFLTAILYERIKPSNVKWNILDERTKYLRSKLQ